MSESRIFTDYVDYADFKTFYCQIIGSVSGD